MYCSAGMLPPRGNPQYVGTELHDVSSYSRSSTLRTYAGHTSLPGGKVDPEDKTIEDTAVSRTISLYGTKP